ncbi:MULTISPECIES: hypothetical protein [unclassified Streptomyces]|uniref:hypothetical protein n=1 Tax=unclassified Streptomyces TaxID=2593676 RepID=UPI0037A7BCB0
MTSAPSVDGQIIGQAHYATRAVLESLLATTGTTFHQALALNALAARGGTADRSWLVARLTTGLKIDAATAEEVLASLTASGLLTASADDGARLGFTEAGQERQAAIADGTAKIVAPLYADLPAEDLATTARILLTLTERADKALASA